MSIVVELALAVVGGLLMGRLTKIETIDGRIKSRLTGPGQAGRLRLHRGPDRHGRAGSMTGAELALQRAPLILLMVAVVRIQALAITWKRVNRHQAIGTDRPDHPDPRHRPGVTNRQH